MPAYKDKAKGTWYASFYYEDWTGKKVKKMKRGFPTKREALEWERTFLQQQTADLEMTFENFVAVYVADMKGRIKENTWGTKEHILYKKLVPYFGKRKMCDIHSKEVIAWQNEMLGYRDKNGKPYSPVYLKTLHNQLSAVFNHAVRHYNLKVNPAAQAGNMGKPKGREMLFWTKAEYLKFAEAMMDKPLSYYAFEMLYWCGVREGELLALTPGDFDFEKQTVTISKSYQRIKGKDVITDPKTPKSNRVIQMPAFLCEEMRDYIKSLYGVKPTDRIFTVTKSYLHREMDRGAKEAGVKRIRIHDLRHLTDTTAGETKLWLSGCPRMRTGKLKPLCGSPALPNRTTSPDGCCAGMWWYRATPGCIRPCGTSWPPFWKNWSVSRPGMAWMGSCWTPSG